MRGTILLFFQGRGGPEPHWLCALESIFGVKKKDFVPDFLHCRHIIKGIVDISKNILIRLTVR